MDAITTPDPVFSRDGTHWHPHAEARGPFGGLHGGAISGLIVAEMERQAREHGFGIPVAASVLLLRPAPMTPLETRSEVLRRGARVGAIETSLLAEGKLIAKGSASFVTPVAVEGAPEAAPRPYDPSALPKWISRRHFDHKTFFDAQDIRDDGNGANWARMIRPLVSFAAPLASVFAVADSATVFPLVAQNIPAPWTFPNIDIGIHLSRLPCGDWVGMEPVSDWRSEGMGFTETRLYDTDGWIGRACQTVVLTPRG